MRALIAAAIVTLGGAALALPWWTAPPAVLLAAGAPALPAAQMTGWAVVGPLAAATTGGLALLALIAAAVAQASAGAEAGQSNNTMRRVSVGGARMYGRTVTTAAGAALAATAAVSSGTGATPWPWMAAVAGITGVLLSAGRPLWVLTLAVLVGAAAVLVPRALTPAPTAAGPFVQVATLEGDPPSGTARTLPALGPGGRLVVADGEVGVATAAGITVLDAAGRARVLARSPGAAGEPPPFGIADGRAARLVTADRIAVTGLHPGDATDVEVYAVTVAGPVGADGSLWLRANGDPPGTIRILPLARYRGTWRLAATYLPVVTISIPDGAVPIDVTTVVPIQGGGLRLIEGRLERITPTPGSADVTTIAGGNQACGPAGAVSPAGAGPLTATPDGTAWFVAGDRLVRFDPAKGLQVVMSPVPGHVAAVAVLPDGAVALAVDGPSEAGLWLLRDPAAALTDTCGP